MRREGFPSTPTTGTQCRGEDLIAPDFKHAPAAIFQRSRVDELGPEFPVGRPKSFSVRVLDDDHSLELNRLEATKDFFADGG